MPNILLTKNSKNNNFLYDASRNQLIEYEESKKILSEAKRKLKDLEEKIKEDEKRKEEERRANIARKNCM